MAGARLWNSLLPDIVACDKLSRLRRELKTFLTQKFFQSAHADCAPILSPVMITRATTTSWQFLDKLGDDSASIARGCHSDSWASCLSQLQNHLCYINVMKSIWGHIARSNRISCTNNLSPWRQHLAPPIVPSRMLVGDECAYTSTDILSRFSVRTGIVKILSTLETMS